MTSREQSPPPTTPGTPAGQGGVRLYTRGPVSHAWLARYAVPAWQRASEGGRRLAHLRRGWRYGPHVDLVVDGASPAQLRDLAQGLDAGPAPAAGEAVTETDYLPMARELGRLEAVPPPYLPMRATATSRSSTPPRSAPASLRSTSSAWSAGADSASPWPRPCPAWRSVPSAPLAGSRRS